MAERPGLRAGDVLPALTTLSFDIAGLELYLPLAVGGRVEVVGREEAADGALLAARLASLRRHRGCRRRRPPGGCCSTRAGRGSRACEVLCGGEALPRDLAAALLARGVALWNVYGPTETTVWSAAGEVAAGRGSGAARPADRQHPAPRARPRPSAGAGGGAGRAADRRRRAGPRLSRPAGPDGGDVRPRPASARPGARLYRTGDLVRWRPDGRAGVPRPHRPPGEGARLPHRAGGDRGGAAAPSGRVAQAVVVVREDGGRQAPGGLSRRRRAPAGERAAAVPAGSACRSTWSRRPS